ncbi:MAG TPA: endonuclease V [Thermomicrobiales bacterium]|nr:endonuclease V [Thermomicrobiales bacterium]
MQLRHPHAWNVSVAEAREIQRELAPLVTLEDAVAVPDLRSVAGVDNGYVKGEAGFTGYAAAVPFEFPELTSGEAVFAERLAEFPYVPGFLTFREGPAMLDALLRLDPEPDVILVDGHGYAHPRRFGIASHLGVVLDHPTIGCAKSILVGRYEEPADEFGAHTPLIDRGDVVGAAVRTRPGHAPLFVSPGHKLSVETALDIVLACCRDGGYLPVPTQAAHEAVAEYTKPLRRKGSRRTS